MEAAIVSWKKTLAQIGEGPAFFWPERRGAATLQDGGQDAQDARVRMRGMNAFAQNVWPQVLTALGKCAGVYWGWVQRGLVWASRHSGIPAIVICAIALVVVWRIARRSARFVAHVSVVLFVLLVLARLGILRF
jgi:hypothetical protein